MDNKKWGSRFATIFWWSLAILPLVIPLIQFIGYHLTFNSGISNASDLATYHDNSIGNYLYFLKSCCGYGVSNSFYYYSISFIRNMFYDLFINLSFETGIAQLLCSIFGWMTSVVFYHLLFDFIVWLPRWMHKIMGKGFDDLK